MSNECIHINKGEIHINTKKKWKNKMNKLCKTRKENERKMKYIAFYILQDLLF